METIAARKYAIIEKVMHLSEEELIELEVSLTRFSQEENILLMRISRNK